jgi:hypothetical protein
MNKRDVHILNTSSRWKMNGHFVTPTGSAPNSGNREGTHLSTRRRRSYLLLSMQWKLCTEMSPAIPQRRANSLERDLMKRMRYVTVRLEGRSVRLLRLNVDWQNITPQIICNNLKTQGLTHIRHARNRVRFQKETRLALNSDPRY